MKKALSVVLFILFGAGGVFGQTPPGAYSSSGTGGGSSGGALTPTSVSGTTAGVFTLAQQNDNFLFSTGAGLTAGAILNFNGTQTFKLTDGLASVVNIPTSGVTNAFTNNYGAYCWNPNGNATGQFGWVGCVGYFSQVVAAASGARAWAANFGVADLASQTGNFIYGNEYDIQVNNNTTQGAGTLYSFRGNGQPTGDLFPALTIQPPAGTGTFTSGYRCESGSLSSANGRTCLSINQAVAGLSQNSQQIQWTASDASAQFTGAASVEKGHYMFLGGMPIINYGAVNGAAGFGGGWGITLTATATLSQNQLVKIDTANADSVVVCTTADTSCHGFVVAADNCLATSTFCGIVNTPGSLVKGILGTGTCSIGNFVIVDTTTNGRVKCTATAPPANAMIGIAVSAQAVVGSLVDLIMTGQPQTAAAAAPLPVYNNSGTLQASAHAVFGSGTLSGGTLTVTLSGAAVYTSSSTYTCTADDSTGLNGMDVTYASGSSVTFNGTTTDTFRYMCIGN